MKLSSVSPDLWLAMTPQPASLAILTAIMDSVTVPIWFTYIQTSSSGQCPVKYSTTKCTALLQDCCQQSMTQLLACQMIPFQTVQSIEQEIWKSVLRPFRV